MNLLRQTSNHYYGWSGIPNQWINDNDRSYHDKFFDNKNYEDFYFDNFYDMDEMFGHENSLFGTRGLPVGHPNRSSKSFDTYNKKFGPMIVRVIKNNDLQENIRRMLREIEEDRIQIRLGRSAERHFGTVQNIIIQVDNEDITGQDGEPGLGKMNIVIKDGEIIVGDIFIPEKYRRQGIATQVYQKISDHFGLPIVNSKTKGFNQTMEGGYMWKDREKFEPRNLQESIRRILREEVPPQVRRRIDDYDDIFEKYRKSFLPNKYRAFFVFWNLLMEVTMETIYHVWFKETVSDEDWDDSSDYIIKYLTKKYKDETEQMWNKKNQINESEDNKQKNIQKNLRVIKELINMVDYSEICDMWVEYNNEDGYYDIKSKMATKNHNTKALEKEFRFLESSLKDLKLKSHVFHPHWVEECEDENKLNESEETNSILHNLINMLFDGFDGTDYDWANYMCGMGECCDPYAIGFVLPKNDYDDYIFKLVDSVNYDDDGDYPKELRDELPEVCYESPDIKNPNFDTIVFYGLYAEEIEDYMGPESNWRSDLLNIINKKFGCEAKQIIII